MGHFFEQILMSWAQSQFIKKKLYVPPPSPSKGLVGFFRHPLPPTGTQYELLANYKESNKDGFRPIRVGPRETVGIFAADVKITTRKCRDLTCRPIVVNYFAKHPCRFQLTRRWADFTVVSGCCALRLTFYCRRFSIGNDRAKIIVY